MKILIVYAHSSHTSFCHALLEQFTKGLENGGHTYEILDLYAMRFDPVITARDMPNWIDESIPPDLLESMNLKQQLLDASHGPLQRFMMKRALRNKSSVDIVKLIRQHKPKDIVMHQEKVAQAQGLAFISPVYFVGFPAILKGWIDRVFSLDFAFGLTPEGWKGDINGRVPLLKHEKALIINTTLFNEEAYHSLGLGEAMERLMDEWCFRYPGIQKVEHVYFYAVGGVGDATRQSYLQRAYLLGKEFEQAERMQEVNPV
jgi:NAD(P)H dehydrogenase (quinone)